MLSFAFFRKKNQRKNDSWVDLEVEPKNADKRGLSKPSYFHGVMKKSAPPLDERLDYVTENTHPPPVVSPPTASKSIILSKVSIDKPLPPTPVFNAMTMSTSNAIAPNTCKTRRIIAPLSTNELHDLFSGAPHFLACANASWDHDAAPYPAVVFPWDSKECFKKLRDHINLEEPAWNYISASLFRPPNDKKIQGTIEKYETVNFDFLSMYGERPSMISMQGQEKGTIGYCAALELPIANHGNLRDYTSHDILFHRANFLKSNNLLRALSEPIIGSRLVELSRVYDVGLFKQQRSAAHLYVELFTRIFLPIPKASDLDDLYSFDVQIYYLLQVLSIPTLWIDFSNVEWQLWLGQALWELPSRASLKDRACLYGIAEKEVLNTQRYWLLLQILLGCEILLRLETLTTDNQHRHLSMLLENFGQESTRSIIWTLHLARVWLENIRIEKPNSGNLLKENNLVSRLSASSTTEEAEIMSRDLFGCMKYHGRHRARQLSGLLHFAEAINWPNLEKVRIKLEAIKTNDFQPVSGWHTASYINGLMLPGGSLSCLIISTLLENDSDAPSKLGNQINSHGGFIYQGKSFWSSSCIIGKVLAASRKASECMGWISSDILPTDIIENWIHIRTKGINPKSSKARIWHKNSIKKQSDVIAGTDPSSVLTGDFILLSDKPIVNSLSVNLLSLDLNLSSHTTLVERQHPAFGSKIETRGQRSFSPTLRFLIRTIGESEIEFRIKLAYDVQFATVHPCVNPVNIDILQSPTNPSFKNSTVKSKEMPHGHPLYKAFTYTKIPLSHILSIPLKTRFSTIISQPISPDPSQSSLHTTSSSIPKVLVIDCTGPQLNTKGSTTCDTGTDREVLARAICAERGWNALISRQGQACLACSIREAGALGWRVIIRIT